MTAVAGPLHLFAVVLLVSGAQKLVSPRPATQAMRDAGLPTVLPGALAGVSLGAVEIAIGLTTLAVPARGAAAALGVLYLLLAGFVVLLRRRNGDAGCGCFGSASTPPTRAHVVLDLTGAAAGFVAAVGGVPDIVDVFDDGFGAAVPYVVLLAIGAGLVLLGPVLFGELDRQRRATESVPTFAMTHTGGDR